MYTISKHKQLSLPKIKKIEKEANQDSFNCYEYGLPQDDFDISSLDNVAKLDDWSKVKLSGRKRKNQTAESLVFLYKNHGKFQTTRASKLMNENITQAGIFLAKIGHEFAKIKNINYSSIYQNIEYCKGVYENNVNLLMKTVQGHKKEIEELMDRKEYEISQMRTFHIANINEMVKDKEGVDTDKIAQFRERISMKENQLQPLKKYLKRLEQANDKILKFALELGYDVRSEGLVWILKKLPEVPSLNEFPSFLNEKQKNYLISKHLNNFKLGEIEKQKENVHIEEKEIIKEAFNNVQRDRERRLSMIKQQELLAKLKQEKVMSRNGEHRYLNSDTIKLVEENNNIKATKYEIIYQQTIKKLNRLCIEEIYGKKSKRNNAKPSKILQDVKNTLSHSLKLKEEENKIRTGEEKQLFEIVKGLRNQKYEPNHPKHRNPISVLCSLLGWKKAKKIIQNQMNITLAPSF